MGLANHRHFKVKNCDLRSTRPNDLLVADEIKPNVTTAHRPEPNVGTQLPEIVSQIADSQNPVFQSAFFQKELHS